MEPEKRKTVSKFPNPESMERQSLKKEGKMRRREEKTEGSLSERIILAAISEFSRSGLKFTMDDVAQNMGISKKTLYTCFDSKEDMLMAIVDYCFRDIKRSEQEILLDPDMDIVDKIKSIIVVLPERYKNIGLSALYSLKDKEPGVYRRLEEHLKTDWDATITLLESGMAQGRIKKISIPLLIAMIESSIAGFFSGNVLGEAGLTYEEGLEQLIDIVMDGIVTEPGGK